MQSVGVVLDHNVSQSFSHDEQFLGIDAVFKARQCWLRAEALPIDGIAVEQKLLDRIVGQGVGIIAIRIAGCDAEYTLTEKIPIAMKDFAGLSEVEHAGVKSLGQSKFVIDSFQQNRATIGTAVRLIKGDGNRLVKFFAEKNRLCGKLSHHKALVCVFILIGLKYLYARKGFLFYIFMNNSG